MIDESVERLMGIGSEQAAFPTTSRYHTVGTQKMETADGRAIKYLKRRFVPQPETLGLLREHRVKEDDRLDQIAAAYLGDSTLFWRICDANRALRPDELLETANRLLRIAPPEGLG